ncbi:hypothetical protein [Anatilimnocola floriformis]|uniref:hypothetical protein n=1 Tax=Anatilimnocola floriformis TaxID=2948575 RepID=UPI0020C46E19|nr:hypothetical protein [Anatilimnocola floriformis]
MSTGFDPYRKWLGIPPKDQPANYYRLLGVSTFEDDLQVIEDSAARQIAYVRTFNSGEYAPYSKKVLGELNAARVTLLQRDKKKVYDEQLQQKMAAQVAAKKAAAAAAAPAVPQPEPPYAQPEPAYPQQPAFPQQQPAWPQAYPQQPEWPQQPTWPQQPGPYPPQQPIFPQAYAPEPEYYPQQPFAQPATPPPPPPAGSGSKRVPVSKAVQPGKPAAKQVTPPPPPPPSATPRQTQPIQPPPPPGAKKNAPISVAAPVPGPDFGASAPVGQFPETAGQFPEMAGQFPAQTGQFPAAVHTPAAGSRRGAAPARRGGGGKGGKQNPLVLVLGGMALLCVVAIGAVLYSFNQEPEKPKIAKKPAAPVEEPAVEPAVEPVAPPPMPVAPAAADPMATTPAETPATTPMPMGETPPAVPGNATPGSPPTIPVAPQPPAKKEEPIAVLNAARKALQERDNDGFKVQSEKLDALLAEYKGANAAQITQQGEQLKEIAKFLKIFWDAVTETASKGMVPGERYRFRGVVFEYSSFENGEMEYRLDGKRDSYAPKEFPPAVALIIAYRAFSNDDVEGKTAIGMFASFDPAAIKEPANQAMTARILQDFQNFGDDINKTLQNLHGRIKEADGEADSSPPQRMKIK